MPPRSSLPPSTQVHSRRGLLASRHDDPLDASLTFDDVTMLGFALIAVLSAVALLTLGF